MKTSLISLVLLVITGCSTNVENVKAVSEKSSAKLIINENNSSDIESYEFRPIRPPDYSSCGTSDSEMQLAKLIALDREQQRVEINCNEHLSKLATQQAYSLSKAKKVSHYIGGSPNKRLELAGFPLTDLDKTQDNTVEAIIGGEKDPEEVWFLLKASFGHKRHLLGEHKYYLRQTELGVGYARNWESPHVDYWVIFFAEQNNKKSEKYLNEEIPIKNVTN